MKWKDKKVGVLMGGFSKEREISLRSGKAVTDALKRKGYEVCSIDCDVDLPVALKNNAVAVAFVTLHGNWGEDGCVQGILEWMKIPYTGSGVLASSMAMDKAVLNQWVGPMGVITPRGVLYNEGMNVPFALPWIVKPSREGSTINVSIVREEKALAAAVRMALQSDTKVLVEEYIQGVEVTISLLCGRALPAIEIAPKSGFYDYESKYTKGKTDYLIPARVSLHALQKMNAVAEQLFAALDCAGVARADFIVKGDQPCFLEINTIPGMTETSLVPKAAAAAGIDFDQLTEQILNDARLKVGHEK